MPSQKQSPAPKQKKPGNKFFAIAILIGVVALACIWVNEKSKPRSPVRTAKPNAQITTPAAKSSAISVLVMTKSNVPADKATNLTVFSQSKTQAVAPKILPNTNFVSTNSSSVRPVQTILEAQVALARLGISAGSIDGVIGSQTRSALRAFQQAHGFPASGELDVATKNKLLLTAPLYTEFYVTPNDLASLRTLGSNWWSKAQQEHLAYETLLEMVSEKTCCHPNFLRRLNPSVNWTNTFPSVLRVLNVGKPKAFSSAAFIRVRLSEKTLEAFDGNTNLLAHFPCSIAQRVEKRPVGQLHIATIAENPDYTFNPENFPESAEARQINTKLILSPGPNNPVGTVWIGLDKPGYGIHGTPNPEAVGRTESHGCFRLANWNAEYLLQLVSVGTSVSVEP